MLDLKKEVIKRQAQVLLGKGCGEKGEDESDLQEGMRVETPAGMATITSIGICPILQRWRCGVRTDINQADGSHFRAFHLSEVKSIVQQPLKIFM